MASCLWTIKKYAKGRKGRENLTSPTNQSNDASARRGYPLGTLFVLVTVSAVLTAGLTPSVRAVAADKMKFWDPIVAAGIALAVLAFIGACAGGLYYPHWRGLAVGGLAGALVGIVAGPLALVPHQDLLSVSLAMFAGSVVAVAIAAVMRRREE